MNYFSLNLSYYNIVAIGKAVAFDIGYPWFESCHQHFYLLSTVGIEKMYLVYESH